MAKFTNLDYVTSMIERLKNIEQMVDYSQKYILSGFGGCNFT
jgi:hypothetical protein